MSNPTQPQIDKLTTNTTRWDNIINGSASTTVALDSFTVKTVAGCLQELRAINPRGTWVSGTTYALKDVVVESTTVYICTIAHTGGTFATDLAAGKWAVYQLDVTSAITFGDDFTVDTNTLHVDSSNNRVGIGTSTPNTKLEIEKTQADDLSSGENAHLYLSNTTTINNTGRTAIFLSTTGAASSKYGISLSADRRQDNGSPYLNIRRHFNDAAGTSALLINNDGNIGVGTETPNTKLEIEKTQADDLSSGENAHLYLSNTTTINNTGRTAIFLSTTGAASSKYGISLSADRRQDNGSPYLNIRRHFNDAAGTSALLINNDGNIGVGTETPNAVLDITGTSTGRGLRIVETSTTHLTGAYALEVDNSAHTSNTISAGAMKVDVNSGRAFTIDGLGKVAIGTTSGANTYNFGIGKLSIESNVYTLTNTVAYNNSNSGIPAVAISKSRGSSSSPIALEDDDRIGYYYGMGYDGTNFRAAASIEFKVDGNVSTGVMPGKIVFRTSEAGTSDPSSHMTIDSAGNVGIGTNNPDEKAVLTLKSTSKGFLPPRMSQSQRNAISIPPEGLIIYNTSTEKLNIYTSSWEEISST